MTSEEPERLLDWQKNALCRPGGGNEKLAANFFSADASKRYQAKNLCFECPVRASCIKWALENNTIWGVWGGRDETEIRRTLSVDAEGKETRRGRKPQCGYCGARTSQLKVKIIDLPGGGRWTTAKVVECVQCGFEWRSRTSANAVEAYHAERAAKKAKREAAKAKK